MLETCQNLARYEGQHWDLQQKLTHTLKRIAIPILLWKVVPFLFNRNPEFKKEIPHLHHAFVELSVGILFILYQFLSNIYTSYKSVERLPGCLIRFPPHQHTSTTKATRISLEPHQLLALIKKTTRGRGRRRFQHQRAT